MINERVRFSAAYRRFKFELLKSLGFFMLINKLPGYQIKQPWAKLYQRVKK